MLRLRRSSGPDTDMDESIEGGSPAADQSFSGGLSTTDFEGASLEVRLARMCMRSWNWRQSHICGSEMRFLLLNLRLSRSPPYTALAPRR